MNNWTATGNVGRDPEFRTTQGGMLVGNFSFATSRKVKEEWVSSWHSVKVFGKTAEKLQGVLKKGSKIFLAGSYELEQWVAKDGTKKSSHVVFASVVELLQKIEQTNQNGSQSVDLSGNGGSEEQHF